MRNLTHTKNLYVRKLQHLSIKLKPLAQKYLKNIKNNTCKSDVFQITWILQHFRSSRQVFYKKGVLRNFSKFTGKHLCQRLFLIKLQAAWNFIKKESLTQVFSCEFWEISTNTFFRTPLVAASDTSLAHSLMQNVSFYS